MGSSIILHSYKAIKEYVTFQQKPVWRNLIGLTMMQLITLYGLGPYFFWGDIRTAICVLAVGYVAATGVSVGAHRLWTHKTYKAKLPLRICLMLSYMLAGQYSIVQWVRDHRLHHKATDTDADPHNSKRGFIFSHCGWLTMRRHPEVIRVGKLIDVSDVLEDPVIQFHQKHFTSLFVVIFLILPCFIPLLWNEPWTTCIMSMIFVRLGIQLNLVWTVNSIAHFWGSKPYNKNIMASQNVLVAFIGLGEGWHNYHHVFPWDYKVSAAGTYLQIGTVIIKFFELIGQAYDLKEASPELIKKVLDRVNTSEPITEVAMPESHINMKSKLADIKEKYI